MLLCNACHLLLHVYSANLGIFTASLKHCSKLASQTCVYLLFKAFHYHVEQRAIKTFGLMERYLDEAPVNKVCVIAFVECYILRQHESLEPILCHRRTCAFRKIPCASIILLQVYLCGALCEDRMWLSFM